MSNSNQDDWKLSCLHASYHFMDSYGPYIHKVLYWNRGHIYALYGPAFRVVHWDQDILKYIWFYCDVKMNIFASGMNLLGERHIGGMKYETKITW